MSFFEINSYRKAIKFLLEQRKSLGSKLSFSDMASHMGIQKTYLSKVMHGQAELNLDQVFGASSYLNCSSEQSQYLRLLCDWERSSHKQRKDLLWQEILELRSKVLETSNYLETARTVDAAGYREYYANPYLQLIHNLLSIDKYCNDFKRISDVLDISMERLQQYLRRLEDIGLIEPKSGRYEVLVKDLHLGADSDMTPVNHSLMRQLSASQVLRSDDPGLRLSVTFTADDATRKEIHMALLKTLEGLEKKVKSAPSEGLYQLNLDLFTWAS